MKLADEVIQGFGKKGVAESSVSDKHKKFAKLLKLKISASDVQDDVLGLKTSNTFNLDRTALKALLSSEIDTVTFNMISKEIEIVFK